MRKLFSLLLAVLMVVSCIPAALSFGVAAEEPAAPEAPAVSYKDPRDAEGAEVTTWYAGVDAAKIPEGGIAKGSTVIGALTAYAYTETWSKDAVLVIKFDGTEQALTTENNSSIGKHKSAFFGVCTIFRADGSRLPIVVEGMGDDAKVQFTVPYTNYYFNANNFFCTNFELSVTTTGTSKNTSLYAGSGNIVFDDVTIASDSAAYFKFWGDNYFGDAFYKWDTTKIAENQGEDGLIQTSITFGKNFKFARGTTTAPVVAAVGAHSPNVNKANDNYVAKFLPTSNTVGLTDALISEMKSLADLNVFSKGSFVTTSPVLPKDTKTCIIVDTGTVDSATADIEHVSVRAGYNPVGNACVIVNSGNVNTIAPDLQTNNKSVREIYTGSNTIQVNGGNIITGIKSLNASYLIGDYTFEMNGGTITRFDATENNTVQTQINGNYLFKATDGTLKNYYGSCPVYGAGKTITNDIQGGNFTSVFSAVRFGASDVVNKISGGTFDCDFQGGSRNNYAINSITNVITGDYHFPNFKGKFISGSTGNKAVTTLTNNISGGCFSKAIEAGTAGASNYSSNVISTSAEDTIKFASSSSTTTLTLAFDKFEMNGGTVHFYNAAVTANNASGSFTVRNTTNWVDGKTYFTFTPAEGKTLNIDTTQLASITTRGEVAVEGGKYLVRTSTGIAPIGASLVLNERIAVKFVFAKSDVDAIGKDNFAAAVLLNDFDIAAASALVEDGDTYTLTTLGIGLPDAKTPFTLVGDGIKATGHSIASLADTAITAWATTEPEWAEWAKALKNLIGVAVDGSANTIAPADKDYGTFTAGKNETVTGAVATLVMNSAVGVELDLTCATLPATPVVKVNGKEIANVYTTEGSTATVTLYFAPQAMEKTFTVQILDGTVEIFSLEASVAGFAKILNTDAGNALLAYIQATTVVAGK